MLSRQEEGGSYGIQRSELVFLAGSSNSSPLKLSVKFERYVPRSRSSSAPQKRKLAVIKRVSLGWLWKGTGRRLHDQAASPAQAGSFNPHESEVDAFGITRWVQTRAAVSRRPWTGE